ncbi:MAG: hypothetical protein ABW245_01160 [Gaiellaceae bacterium]
MILAISTLLLAALAADPPPPSLLGRWTAVSENAKGASFEFEPADKVVWRTHKQPWSLAYKLDTTVAPWALDLVGFADGPLKDRTLYCIVERTGDRFRMDCEPGAPNAEGAKKRPAAFVPEQTQEFERAR